MDMDTTTIFKFAIAALFALEGGINMAGRRSFIIPLRAYTDESVKKFLLPNGIAMLFIAAAFASSAGIESVQNPQLILCGVLLLIGVGILIWSYTKILKKK